MRQEKINLDLEPAFALEIQKRVFCPVRELFCPGSVDRGSA
jgi:hypothetical protein